MKSRRLGICVLLMVATFSLTARAQPYVTGTVGACSAYRGDQVSNVWHSPMYGVMNNSNSSTNIVCPLVTGTNQSTSVPITHGIVMWYYDGSNTAPFECQVIRTDYNYNYWWYQSLYTCSVPGGCVDPTTAWVGNSYLYFTGLNYEPGSLFIGSNTTVSCGLPPASGSQWPSTITAYYTQ